MAKDTVNSANETYAIRQRKNPARPKPHYQQDVKIEDKAFTSPCGRCGKTEHTGKMYRYILATCNYCKKVGHVERACLKKEKDPTQFVQTVKLIKSTPQIKQTICLDGEEMCFEVDTGAGDSFLSYTNWQKMGQPPLQESKKRFESASGHSLPALGVFQPKSVYVNGENKEMCAKNINFVVTELPQLNLLGRNVIVQLGVSIDNLLYSENMFFVSKRDVKPVLQCMEAETSLQIACKQMCQDFPDVFK